MELDKEKFGKLESSVKIYFTMLDHNAEKEMIINCIKSIVPKEIVDSIIESKLKSNEFIDFIQKLKLEHKIFNNEELYLYNKIKNYIYKETTRFDRIRDTIRLEFKNKDCNSNKKYIYDNQIEAAVEIMEYLFNEDIKAVSLVALPQVGKTGTFVYCTYLAMTHPDNEKIFEPENIFIISGLNDLEWEKQTKDDMLESLKNNVYHLGQLNKFNEKVNSINNSKILIIIDECQVATSANQSIDKIISNLENNTNNNCNEVKYLVVSATLSVIKYELDEWGDRHKVVFLKSPLVYIGFSNFINENRTYDSEQITKDFLDKKIKPLLENRFKEPKYHILRITKNKREELINWIKDNNVKLKLDKDPICVDSDKENPKNKIRDFDIYNMLENIPPTKHTFVIIKNFWRAGKRMHDKNIGIVYEYSKDINYDTTAQGLIGRFCGNDKQKNSPTAPIFFCKKETLIGYMTFYKEGCDYSAADYISTKLKIKDNELEKIKKSFVNSILEDKSSPHSLTRKEEYVDIPREIIISPNDFKKIQLKEGDKKKSDILLNIIKEKDEKLYEILKDYQCDKCTSPDQKLGENHYSYKRHIKDARKNYNDKKPYLADFKLETKENNENAWTAFIDWKLTNGNHTVYLNVYHGKKKLKLSEERKELIKQKKNTQQQKNIIID
jgi:hypothetical protein